MSERPGKMPRAEGYAGGRRVGPDEDAVIMGWEPREWKVGKSVDTKLQHYSADRVINESSEKDGLPMITEEEFRDLHSKDEKVSLVAEKLFKQRMSECGLDPEQEGVVRIMVGDRELKIGIGNDLGTVLKED